MLFVTSWLIAVLVLVGLVTLGVLVFLRFFIPEKQPPAPEETLHEKIEKNKAKDNYLQAVGDVFKETLDGPSTGKTEGEGGDKEVETKEDENEDFESRRKALEMVNLNL